MRHVELIICPICGVKKECKYVFRWFKRHLKEFHDIFDVVVFLKETYYPKYHPDRNRSCTICGSETKFLGFREGFKSTCSTICTNLLIYGVENPAQSSLVKEKFRKTCLERYGVDNPSQDLNIKRKKEKTTLKNFGVNHHFHSKEIKDNIKETNIKKYGAPQPFGSKYIRDKIKQTNLDRYGVNNPNKNKQIREKTKITCLERYGVSTALNAPFIKNNIKIEHRNKYYKIFLELLNKKSIAILSNKEEYIRNIIDKNTLEYKCLLCGSIFEDTKLRQVDRINCPKCSNPVGVSSYEYDIINVLTDLNVKTSQSNKILYFPDDKYPKEIDIYIPYHKLGIEVDGLWCHSEQHKPEDYHLKKTEAAEQLGIQLLHITDSEWVNKREIVKSIILSKLGIYKERIYARSCIIKEIPNKEYKEFLEDNHLKGYCLAKCKLGLYHKDTLVQICSFSKSRFKKDEMELIRHCSLINYQVLGGLSRLLKHYMRNYHPSDGTKLITYVDRRYSSYKGYEKVGFKLIETLSPNYFYFSRDQYYLQSRVKYQKHKLHKILENFDPSLTEMENMRNHGYSIYYDCGNYKLEYDLLGSVRNTTNTEEVN